MTSAEQTIAASLCKANYQRAEEDIAANYHIGNYQNVAANYRRANYQNVVSNYQNVATNYQNVAARYQNIAGNYRIAYRTTAPTALNFSD